MISARTLKGNPGDAEKYLVEMAKVERYYSTSQEQRRDIERGVYHGGQSLGLDGQIVGTEFHNILDARKATGEILYTRGRNGRRIGFDLTFSPDKSVSLLWARLDEHDRQRLEDSFRNSVEETISYIEKNVLNTCVRRGPGGLIREAPKELTWALFQHGSSRAHDPQLHIHAILMNFAQREDGGYGAINEKAIFEKQTEIRRVFDLSLASQLGRDLGVQLTRSQDGIRIEGISQDLIDTYSKRRAEIEQAAEEKGLTTKQAGQFITMQTRREKDRSIDDRDLIPQWQQSFDSQGFTRDVAYSVIDRKQQTQTLQNKLSDIVDKLVTELDKKRQALTESEFRALCAENVVCRATLPELESVVSAASQDPRIVKIEREGTSPRFTTKQGLEVENDVLNLGRQLAKRQTHQTDEHERERILSLHVENGMSEEQRKATEHILESQALTMLVGAAGTGKSFSLKATREVLEASGYTVRGLAPTGKAADNLQQSTAIFSKTVDKFLHDFEKGKDEFRHFDIIVIDEAAMLGNIKTHRILQAAHDAGAKVILVGDDKQLAALDRGRPFDKLKGEIGAVEITTVRRQKHEWQREAANDLREGRIKEAFIRYQDGRLVHHSDSWETTKEKLVSDWMRDRDNYPEERQLILASSNEKVQQINHAIREQLKDKGGLKHEAKIGISRNDGSFANKEFAIGERIYFTRNSAELEVKNGTLGTLEECRRIKRGVFEMTARLDSGQSVSFSTETYNSLEHGYAATVHKSQGDTVERTYLVAEKFMDKEAAYVAMTRHREECRIYCATELIHGYRRNFEQEQETDRKVKLHLDKLTKNIAQTTDTKQEGPAIKPPEPAKPEKVYITAEHLEAAQKLVSRDRDEITEALHQLSTLPKGVEHRYSTYDRNQPDYQKESANILASHDYNERRLQALRESIESKELGVSPTLTARERETHYANMQAAYKNRESAHRCNTEMRERYITPKLREHVAEITRAQTDEKCLDRLHSLALEKPAVGRDFGHSADPFHLQREASEQLRNYDGEKTKAWAKEVLRRQYPEGRPLEIKHRPSYVEGIERAHERQQTKVTHEREKERSKKFTTPQHEQTVRLEQKHEQKRSRGKGFSKSR